MIPDETVDRVREEADIVQIVGEFVKLKRVGSGWRGPCPFHHGRNPNFAVSPKGGYVCFKCGEKGDVFTFVQKQLGLDFIDSVKWVGGRAGVDVVETSRRHAPERDPREPLWEVNAAAAEYFQAQLRDERSGAAARDYLLGRALDQAAAERFQLGYAPPHGFARDGAGMREYLRALGFDDQRQIEAGLLVVREEQPEPRARFRNRLMFPILDAQGRIAGFGGRVMGEGEPKYLNSAESDVFSKRKLLYGLNWAKQSIRKADRLLVVEGYFDAIRVMLAGVEEVVAPLGTALTEAQASLIRKYTKNVLLLYDSDGAGQKATFRAADELLRNGIGVRVITLPDGEDPDTFVARHGASGLERAIAASIDVFDRKIQLLDRGGWFADLRHKREALDKLLPTIRVTVDRLSRDLYIQRASEAAGISRDSLERELASGAGARAASREPDEPSRDEDPPYDEPSLDAGRGAGAKRDRPAGRRARGSRAERELVRMLLHQRRYVELVGERIGAESFTHEPYRRIFNELVALGPDADVERIAQSLDEETTGVLEELLQETGGLERVEETVTGSLNAIHQREIDARLTEIDREFTIASPEQKDDLIQEKRKLVREMQSLGRHTRWKGFRQARA